MAEQLASVPEESATGFAAPCPPPNSYRESILSVGVVWPEWRVTSTHSSQSGHSGSNYSSDSGASRSNNSGYSSGSVFAGAADLGAKELTKIAQRMSSDGYLLRIFQTFIESSSSPVVTYDEWCSLENWFVELDADWVLQRHNNHDLRQQLQEAPVSRLEEFVERWIRALIVILASIKELVAATHEMPAVVRFAKASISPMLVFVDAVVHVFELEKLQAALHTYVCVSNASYDMCTMHLISSKAPSFFSDIGAPLDRARQRLRWAISKKMWDLELELDHDDSWPIEILQGESKIHKNIRLLAECIVLMRKAHTSTQKNSAGSHHMGKLIGNLIHNPTGYLKRLILAKSKLFTNPSVRHRSYGRFRTLGSEMCCGKLSPGELFQPGNIIPSPKYVSPAIVSSMKNLAQSRSAALASGVPSSSAGASGSVAPDEEGLVDGGHLSIMLRLLPLLSRHASAPDLDPLLRNKRQAEATAEHRREEDEKEVVGGIDWSV
uniref:Exocyst subunit Exo70 family protein n=1 Tax=Aegilops tauschii TaxID=37682 RepID=M8B3W2_AEGTA